MNNKPVITKNHKLGIILDLAVLYKNRDFRNFGAMFFDRKKDTHEVDNKIDEKQYKKDIKKLRDYYNDFVHLIPSTGKDELVQQKSNKY